jgi:hypothetical protein
LVAIRRLTLHKPSNQKKPCHFVTLSFCGLTLGRSPAGSLRFRFATKPAFSRRFHIDLGVTQATRHVVDTLTLAVHVALDGAVGRRRRGKLARERFAMSLSLPSAEARRIHARPRPPTLAVCERLPNFQGKGPACRGQCALFGAAGPNQVS